MTEIGQDQTGQGLVVRAPYNMTGQIEQTGQWNLSAIFTVPSCFSETPGCATFTKQDFQLQKVEVHSVKHNRAWALTDVTSRMRPSVEYDATELCNEGIYGTYEFEPDIGFFDLLRLLWSFVTYR